MASADKRKSPRRKVNIPVFCWETGEEKARGNGKEVLMRDLSADGMAFYSRQIYPIATVFLIEVYLPNQKEPVCCKLTVVSVEAIPHQGEYIIGGSFFDLKAEDRKRLAVVIDKMDLYVLLDSMIKGGASDLHLTVGRPPMVRRHGKILPMAAEVIESGEVEAMLFPLLTQDQIRFFEEHRELDFAFSPDIHSRFRVNLHKQKGYVEAVLRSVPSHTKSFDDLGLPAETMEKFCRSTSGLILLAGTTGAGKTTTMSAMVSYINKTQRRVVITIEDPVEYMIKSEHSIVKQRELGSDTSSYAEALKRALRQDPDVICVGEILDKECLTAALKAAETGHLVVSTIHAPDTVSAIERAVNLFPPEHAGNIRQQVASCLTGILFQVLLPKAGGGRVAGTEVLINTSATRNLIREGRYAQLATVLQTGRAQGMYTLQSNIQELIMKGLIDEAATAHLLSSQSF